MWWEELAATWTIGIVVAWGDTGAVVAGGGGAYRLTTDILLILANSWRFFQNFQAGGARLDARPIIR